MLQKMIQSCSFLEEQMAILTNCTLTLAMEIQNSSFLEVAVLTRLLLASLSMDSLPATGSTMSLALTSLPRYSSTSLCWCVRFGVRLSAAGGWWQPMSHAHCSSVPGRCTAGIGKSLRTILKQDESLSWIVLNLEHSACSHMHNIMYFQCIIIIVIVIIILS